MASRGTPIIDTDSSRFKCLKCLQIFIETRSIGHLADNEMKFAAVDLIYSVKNVFPYVEKLLPFKWHARTKNCTTINDRHRLSGKNDCSTEKM